MAPPRERLAAAEVPADGGDSWRSKKRFHSESSFKTIKSHPNFPGSP